MANLKPEARFHDEINRQLAAAYTATELSEKRQRLAKAAQWIIRLDKALARDERRAKTIIEVTQ